ncbi:MAG: hypothetical protein HC786_30525 [Richelia sp. CSU_2_1]|nr:hypothetical protein [Richelia sp. CSU_2_1]
MQKTAPFRIKKILRSLNFLILLFATSLSTVNCQLSTINYQLFSYFQFRSIERQI